MYLFGGYQDVTTSVTDQNYGDTNALFVCQLRLSSRANPDSGGDPLLTPPASVQWSNLLTNGEPPSPRESATLACVGDRTRSDLVVFGGCNSFTEHLADTHVFHGLSGCRCSLPNWAFVVFLCFYLIVGGIGSL